MNILVVTLSNFGDVILTTPVITALVRKYPDARITVVVGPRAQAVLQRSSAIHRIVIYDKKAPLSEKLKFIMTLRKVRYDLVIDLRNTAIPFLTFCKKRTPLFRKFTQVNMRDRHLEMLAATVDGVVGPSLEAAQRRDGAQPFCFFNEVDDAFALKTLEIDHVLEKNGWLVVAPGAASERKRWPAEYFIKVIRSLHEKTGKKALLVGVLSERPIAESIAQALPGVTSVFCGDLMLPETAALIARAALLIANDSAAMHLGFELGTPTVGIFGPTDHEKYGHEGPRFRVARGDSSQCFCESHKLPPAERSCFHGLKPETVIGLSLELLNASQSA